MQRLAQPSPKVIVDINEGKQLNIISGINIYVKYTKIKEIKYGIRVKRQFNAKFLRLIIKNFFSLLITFFPIISL